MASNTLQTGLTGVSTTGGVSKLSIKGANIKKKSQCAMISKQMSFQLPFSVLFATITKTKTEQFSLTKLKLKDKFSW